MNTVYVGGDPAKGAAYGYVSWVDGRAILALRNPDRREQKLQVPFDRSVYFREEAGRPYRARAIYPYVEPMPWKLVSGQPISISVPGDSVMLFEIEPGTPEVESSICPESLPTFGSDVVDGGFSIQLDIPDDDFARYDLLVQTWAPVDTVIRIDGEPVSPDQRQRAARWTVARYDLRDYLGRTISVEGSRSDDQEHKVPTEVWLVVDRTVDVPETYTDTGLPFAISQRFRRLTQNLLPKTQL